MNSANSLSLLWSILSVAGGGALGAVARFLVSAWVHKNVEGVFPWGTFIVNVIGSFCFGVIASLIARHLAEMHELRLLLLTGFLGAFTTFATFSFESIWLFEQGKMLLAAGNILGTLLLCLVACFVGLLLGQKI